MLFCIFLLELFVGVFQVFWSNLSVLGRIGRSGMVLGFISSNFEPDPMAGRPQIRGAIIIIVIPVREKDLSNLPLGIVVLMYLVVRYFLRLLLRLLLTPLSFYWLCLTFTVIHCSPLSGWRLQEFCQSRSSSIFAPQGCRFRGKWPRRLSLGDDCIRMSGSPPVLWLSRWEHMQYSRPSL